MLDQKLHTKPFKFFLSVSKKEIKWLVPNILFYALGNVTVFTASYFLGRAVDDLTLAGGHRTHIYLILTVIFIICFEATYRFGHICEVVVLSRVRQNVKKALFDHTTSLSFGYFTDQFAGELAHKVSVTADAIERLIVIANNTFIEGAVLIVVSAAALGVINISFGIFLSVWALVFVVGSLILSRESNRRAGIYAAEEAKTTGSLADIYGNMGTVKVYGRRQNMDTAHEQIDRETRAYVSMSRWDILTFNFRGTFMILLTIGLILITTGLYHKGLITAGTIVFISASALRLFNVVWDIGENVTNFIRARGEILQNLRDLIVPPAIMDGHHKAVKAKSVWVEYVNVGFAYNQKPVLQNFSITIKPKEKVGIVGLSGAGKTTFVNLLLRFFDVQSGQILLNGKNIKDFTQESLRAHISYISQDTSLFHATIAQNIAYGLPTASLANIKHAARLAYADEFIEALPKGYQSVVGERGIKLSGGQRQRITVARALLADRPLFLLDEATSALDSDSEAKIQKGLEVLMENKTVIAIAHRLSTISHLDRIIYLEDGKILEEGSHDQLLLLNGKYAKLWHMQAGGFLPDSV